MATLLPEGKQSFTNSAGAPLIGGKVYTYDAGTSTPRVTYQDSAGTVPNANPVILDARGEATIFWSGTYKVVLKDAADATIWSVDGVASADSYTLALDGPNGASLLGYQPLGGSPTTVQAELDMIRSGAINANDAPYYAKGNANYLSGGVWYEDAGHTIPSADDTLAIQAALNTGRRVYLPSNGYKISSTLLLKGQKLQGLGTSNISGLFDMTRLCVVGNVPAVSNDPAYYSTFEVDGIMPFYGDTIPVGATGNDQKVGFYFNFILGNPGPQFIKISNCLVKGGWRAYDHSGGLYLSILERVWGWNCKFAFRHFGGTTLKLDTCYALGGSQGFYVQGVPGVTAINCAEDYIVVDADTPQGATSVFADIPGLNIGTWNMEHCEAKIDGSSLLFLLNATGVVNGINGFANEVGCSAGEEVYGIRAYNSRISFNGCPIKNNVGDLVFTGTGGNCFTLAASNASAIEITTSNFTKPTGGTPTIAYSLYQDATSAVYYSTTLIDGASNAKQMLADTAQTITPVLNAFTVTGSPIVTGKTWQNGNKVSGLITINPNGGTVASVPNSSRITGLGFTPAQKSLAEHFIVDTYVSGIGQITTFGEIYLPYIGATSSVILIKYEFFTA